MDEQTLERAALGERAATTAVLEQALPRVRNVVRYLAGGDDDVDDIAQRALIAVVAGLPGFRRDGSFPGWVDKIAAREAFQYLRRRRSLRQVEAEATELAAESLVEDARPRYLARRALAVWLDALPEGHRHALVLHHLLGMSVPEVADTLGVPFDTVKSRLRLGMQRLRALREETEVQHVSA